ncbi:MAG: hypothetical protein IPO57_11300 [Rhodocyclales bacterium]|nr:hypothetical protein [Rhodocyclales bacterium]
MCVFAVAIYSIETRIRDRDLAELLGGGGQAVCAEARQGQFHKMMAMPRAMMINLAMVSAFRQGDRAALAQQGGDLFRSLNAEHKITHLYFIRPDPRQPVPLSARPYSADEIQRLTLQEARESQKPVHGLELGPMGTMADPAPGHALATGRRIAWLPGDRRGKRAPARRDPA